MKNWTLLLLTFTMLMNTACKKQPADKMEWWRDARFGMFIHWGLYSVPAGSYQGKEVPGIGEWIMNTGKIPVAEYEKYATQFNPVDFNAEEWVKLAKEAGMKYIVITSKHHDGFAMFHSKVSKYNVVDATPFKRDVIAELAAACKKYNMPFGLYYSQAQDWNAPGGAASGGHWDTAQDGDMDKYLDEKAVPQVSEILNNYGDIKILWWDTPQDMTPERAAKFFPEMKKHPDLIFNNRLGGGVEGDLETPEQYIPATGIPGKNWESCMTMNDTWGYKANDQNWKSAETLVRNLIDIASKGGNYLLNVGPTSLGLIPQASVVRLKEIGAWMKKNGEAIYGTSASPFSDLKWGRCTQKKDGDKVLLFFHIFDFPSNGKLIIPGLSGKILKAYPLADKKHTLQVLSEGNNPEIDLTGVAQDSFATVIVAEIPSDFKVYNAPVIQADFSIFTDTMAFQLKSNIPDAELRFSTDGSVPGKESFLASGINRISPAQSFTLKAACFINNRMVSGVSEMNFRKVSPLTAKKLKGAMPGLSYEYFESKWNNLSGFTSLKPIEKGHCEKPDISAKKRNDNFGFIYTGYLDIPATGIYQLQLTSDDGSELTIDGEILSNDGMHAMETRTLDVALEKGLHPVRIRYFQGGGGDGLEIKWKTAGAEATIIPDHFWKY